MIYFDSLKHTFVELKNEIVFPSVSLLKFEMEEANTFYELLLKNFPNFSDGFFIVKQEILTGQKKYYPYLKVENADNFFLGLELRILATYAGGAKKEDLQKKVMQNYSPSFKTKKIYFHLFMYVIRRFENEKRGNRTLITSIETFPVDKMFPHALSRDEEVFEPWTVSIFDENDHREILQYFRNKIPYEWKLKLWKPPFTVERKTLALNLVHILQFDFMKDDFLAFLLNHEKERYDSENMKTFFSDWKLETSLTENGNLQWKFVEIPFVTLS